MKWEPYPYQERIRDFIIEHPKANVWAEMGLGKTVSTLSALAELFDSFEVTRVLVVAPLRVCLSVWPVELAKWDHLQGISMRHIRAGSPGAREAIVRRPFVGIEVINYENLTWLLRDYIGNKVKGRNQMWADVEMPWDMVIFDESSKLKAPNTQRFRALRRAARCFPRVVNLTGSPAPSGLLNLWAPNFALDQGDRLGSTFVAYKDRWFEKADDMGWSHRPLPHAERQIRERIEDITLSMRSQDYLDLPEVVTHDISATLPATARGVYEELEREMFLQLAGGTVEAVNAAVLTGKCRQLAGGFLYLNGQNTSWETVHKAKLEMLDDVIEEAEGHNLLTVYQFRSELHELKKRYPHAVALDGASDPERIIDRWNRGEIPMLLIHPASAGHGLNLQGGGRRIVFYSLGYSYDQYEQTIARLAGGLRRTDTTFVYRLMMRDTIDVTVAQALAQRREVQELLKEQMARRRAA